MTDRPVPIIIKRKKVVAGGHHGGAWKVAYADFVTAMMAFFLLMWLLGATTEKQRKGIADYFNPTIPINRVSGGGDGAFGGDSVFTESTLADNGTGAGAAVVSDTDSLSDRGTQETEDPAGSGAVDPLAEFASMLNGKAGESMVSDLLKRHIVTRLTDEGLIVELFDIPGVPLFEQDATATSTLVDLVGAVAEVFRLATNDIAVQGHTSSVPLAARANPAWERSARRADEVRKLLTETGLPAQRMQRVTGFADRKPVAMDLLADRNNRIEIILLRSKL
jgi:chemotaxis protein MotB